MSVVSVHCGHIRPNYDNLEEWCSQPDHLYIGRKRMTFAKLKRFPPKDSVWANPFKTGVDGAREEVLEKYRKYITMKISRKEVDLEELRGKVLGCWCKPNSCHGDILLELLQKV